ncbi:MAG: DNA polymerase III subunit chi [Sphingomonadaceae bacterium]|nr:DNA polymerase III subunit chi [Sphingomonadaceae bacterium]
MRVDFYLLSRDPAEKVVPQLAAATRKAGERLLVVGQDSELLAKVDRALWEAKPEAFLAHGVMGEGHEERQPILLSQSSDAANGARYVVLADGLWREEALGYDRAFLLFSEEQRQDARGYWRQLDQHQGVERNFWSQESGRWAQVA